MKRRHILRDVVFLSLPFAVLLVYLAGAGLASFWNGEVESFHGYLVRGTRLGGISNSLQETSRPLRDFGPLHYLPNRKVAPPREVDGLRVVDLRIPGTSLDALAANVPASGREWQEAQLMEESRIHKVDVRYRGQVLSNYYWGRKNWKVKTGKRDLFDGFRVVNLTSMESSRVADHLTYTVAHQLGLPAPRTRPVLLYLNQRYQGLYMQEEQVDESMMRRNGRMPGDVFYGELFVPNEPEDGANDLFWNAHLWRKKSRYNRYPVEYRPHLTALLDAVAATDAASFDRLDALLDRDEFARYFATLCFQGDQHVDRAHNHRMFFNPLSGRFEGVVWNPMMTMPIGRGVETMNNALFRKLCRDPLFLDRVWAADEELRASGMRARLAVILAKLRDVTLPHAYDVGTYRGYLDHLAAHMKARGELFEHLRGTADVRHEESVGAQATTRLVLHVRALASLRLTGLALVAGRTDVRVFEDRDFDGVVSAKDREIVVRVEDGVLVPADDMRVYPGRDFTASYRNLDGRPVAVGGHIGFTRLAWQENPLLLVGAAGTDAPRVKAVHAARTVGSGSVTVVAGAPQDGYRATETVHPWLRPPTPRKELSFSGVIDLKETLRVGPGDTLKVAPGTRFRLASGVSILARCQVKLRNVTVERLDPTRPWGVFALLGSGADGSVLENCTMRGGSDDVLDHIYFSGMFSAHVVRDVVLRGCVFEDNLHGDDTVRFGDCRDLLIEGCTVSRANGDAIDCDISTGMIRDTKVLAPRNDGIDLMTAIVHLERNLVQGAGDKGISFGESASPRVTDCRIIDCVMGFGIKDSSDPQLSGCEIRGCGLAIGAYDKNWRYPGGGRGRLERCVFVDNARLASLDRSSSVRLVDCLVDGEAARGDEAGRLVVETAEDS